MSDHKRPMLGERAIEMINLVVDGEATPQEQAEFEQLLNSSSEARRYYQSMLELTQTLDAVPPAVAPGIKNEVLARLGRSAQPTPVVQFPGRSRRRLILVAAWAAAAVLVLGVALNRLLAPAQGVDRIAPAQAAASMPPRNVNVWPELARVESEGLALTVRKSGDRFALQLQPHQSGLLIRWDESKLALVSGTPEGDLILQRRQGAAGSAALTVMRNENPVLQTSIELR